MRSNPILHASLVLICVPLGATFGSENVVRVSDDASLRAALRQAEAGDRIEIAPGRYSPGVRVSNLKGTRENPIVIGGIPGKPAPEFLGGGQGWHLSDCAFVTLRDMRVAGASGNGINVDDGGGYETPSHHIVLERLQVSDVGPRGNHDALKLSGVDDFIVRDCTFEGWGGQAPDMVGCHRGLVERCVFRGKQGYLQHAGPQTKGGSSEIVIRRCLFFNAAQRGVQMGGSTGMAYFRPQGCLYEARDITVEGCLFVGCQAPLAFVGVDGAVARYNTFYRPGKWVMRILQETTLEGFAPCRNGRFERNIVVFRRADLSTFVNVGPNTRPQTFRFAENLWYCEDRPHQSEPTLPVAETGGVYGVDPRLADPENDRFEPTNPRAARFGASALESPLDDKD